MSPSLKKSIALHLIVFLMWVIDVPLFWRHQTPPSQVPIIVDLQDIKVSEMTNLPPKAKFGEEDKEASQVKRKIEDKYTQDEPEPEPEVKIKEEPKEEVKEAAAEEPKHDFLEAPKPDKKPEKAKPAPKPKRKPMRKPDPKKQPKKKEEPKQLANPLKSLLASVDALEKESNTSSTATIKEGTKVANMGIEGGTVGSYFSDLSISELDALAGRLRACWNLDPGAMGIEDMIVEIRAELMQDGSVRKVDIVDKGRYGSDSHFRSVADSARRAVYICAPYKILSEKYPEKYNEWRVLQLRFNPIDQSVR